MKYAPALLLALFVGAAVAGTQTVRTVTLRSPGGTVVVISETPGPDGAVPTLSIVATLPDGTTLKGLCKGNPGGDWKGDVPLTKNDGDGAGVLPHDRAYRLRFDVDPDEDDGVPDVEGGELNFTDPFLGRGSEPLFY